MSTHLRTTLVLLTLLCAAEVSATNAQVRERLEAHTAKTSTIRAIVGADVPERLEAVRRFYMERGHEPALIGTEMASAVLEALHAAGDEGLVMDASALHRLTSALQAASSGDPDSVAKADVLLCHALLRHMGHLVHGRLVPRSIGWRTTPREFDAEALLREVVSTGSLDPLRTLTPPWPAYAELRAALETLREIEARGGWPALPDGPLLEEGMTDERVPILAERLELAGDLIGERSGDPALYDPALREAVERFQRRHGLLADGVVGPGTRRALNVPVEERIAQVALNLERWRWMPAPPEGRYGLVNAAGGELVIIEDGLPVLHSRVVSGRPDWATPVLVDEIVELHVNPRWYVPRSITVDEVLGILRRNPAWAIRQRMRVESKEGGNVDPRDVDWSAVDADNLPYRLVQEPGPANPLGRYKFVLTNRSAIYLHDTPSKALFELPQRHFSHGCVRVEAAEALAELLLDGSHEERLARAREKGTSLNLALEEPMPVFLLYFTAWVDEEGALQFREDVYKRDRRTAKRLEACRKKPAGKGCR